MHPFNDGGVYPLSANDVPAIDANTFRHTYIDINSKKNHITLGCMKNVLDVMFCLCDINCKSNLASMIRLDSDFHYQEL